MIRRLAIVVAILIATGIAILMSRPAGAVTASCYGNENGQSRTAQGKPYHAWLKTAAHRSLPFGTRVRVTYHGRSIVVPITDRGPYHRQGNRKHAPYDREFDLSLGACSEIGLSLGEVSAEIQ